MSEHKNKKAQFAQPHKKKRLPIILGAALGLIALALIGWNALSGGSTGRYPVVKASQGQILLPAAEVSDGSAHFFTYQTAGTDVNFFVVKSTDGQVRAAIDTCVQCYRGRMGYRQLGEFMVCNKCNQKFHTSQINEIKGGCNPVPLGRVLAGTNLAISEADLIQGAAYFRINP
ncbi:DUF2318 domain-containing protein [Geothrix sp.]|jgi:uncharacterized membrane protein|uniref:DUF2318 domain-containing protein n=1 Tax=Geothrix sp. TaxID=1962974 RepID=UPI0025BD916C|nr:DUF2318 domain-containing protein [Geothrix sp.]